MAGITLLASGCRGNWKEDIMETMKVIVCGRYGPPEVLRFAQYSKPIPKQDEMLIKIYAASVTNSDIFIRSAKVSPLLMIPFRLKMGLRRPRNPVIGEVFAGVVEAAGSGIKRFKPGDRVYGLTGFSLGAYADYLCMGEIDSVRGCLAVMPANISFEDATAAAYGGLLALQQLEKGNIAGGDKVLIYGASGTSGTIAVQYAKHLGAMVTAVCGSWNIEFVRSLGADTVLDYTDAASIGRLESYDLVLDAVGKRRSSALKKASAHALAAGGTYTSIDDGALLLQSDRLDRITKLVESGAIKPVTDRVYAFDQIVEAHRYVEGGHKKGNVAVTVNE
jgi:NADPH:quinone reductase-like Zn-dependent oxidoreductase